MKKHNGFKNVPGGEPMAWGLAAVMMFFQCTPVVFALPRGESVSHGDVTFTRDGDRLTVEQASGKAIVNYSAFDIGGSETVQFMQPGSSAAILNRVSGGGASTIAGSLLANGQVYIINTSGILFTSSARVNVGALVASAMPMSNGDFLGGRLFFSGGGGSVVNQGNLSGSFVYLVGTSVDNSGSISAGRIALAAGQRSVLIDTAAGGEIRMEIDGLEEILGEGGGSAGGDEEAGVSGGDELVEGAVDTTALLTENATDVPQWDPGTVVNEGLLDASGEVGGRIAIRALKAGQAGIATADGTVGGGGTITIHAEEIAALTQDSVTTANAGIDGDGGTITIVSEETAYFLPGARIEARGGSRSGDGGYVEVSGREALTLGGSIDVTAPEGETGTAYIDPVFLNIIDAVGGGTLDLFLPTIFAGLPDLAANTVSWGAIDSLVSSANVILEAQSLIQVSDVTGVAGGNITENNLVKLDLTSGSLTLRTMAGPVAFADVNDTIRTEGGSITIQAGGSGAVQLGNFDSTGNAGNRQGDVTVTAGGSVSMGSVNTGGDNLNVSGTSLFELGPVDADNAGNVNIVFSEDISPANLDITAASILLHAGSDGTGSLQLGGFAPVLNADSISLRAGDGAGTTAAIVDAPTVAFADTAGTGNPATFSMRQDASLPDASIPDATAFPVGVLAGTDYTLQSDGGTVTLDDGTKVADADLTVVGGGATGVDINDSLMVNSLSVAGAADVAGEITSTTDAQFANDVTLDGFSGPQGLFAGGTLTAGGALLKSTSGDLTLSGNTMVDLNGDVTVIDGALLLPDGADAAGGLASSADLTLDNAINLDGAGAQRVDSTAGSLTVTDVNKAAGDLILAGDTGIDINTAINLGGGNLTVADGFTADNGLAASGGVTLDGPGVLDGGGAQTINAQGGTLTVNSTLTKASDDLELRGNTGIDLNDSIDVNGGDLTIRDQANMAGDLMASGDVTLEAPVTFDGAVSQVVDAEGGTLHAQGTLDKTGLGDLTLAGDTLVDLDDDVNVTAGRLLLPDGAEVAGDLASSADLTLDGAIVLDGAGQQRVDSTAGELAVEAVDKNTGDLLLAGQNGIAVNATIDLLNGSLTFEDDVTVVADIFADQDVNFQGAGAFVGVVDQSVEAVNGTLTADGTLDKIGAGDLLLAAGTVVDLNDDVTVHDGRIQLPTGANVAGDLQASGDVDLDSTVVLDGPGPQRIESVGGTLTANDALNKTIGDLALAGGFGIELNASVDLDGGDLTIEDDVTTDDDIVASGNVTLQGNASFDGTGNQLVDAEAGTLHAQGTLGKTTSGDLTLAGGTLVNLDGDVSADDGTVLLPDGANLAANLTVSDNFTLDNTVVLDGGAQRIDSTAGTLTVNGVNKAAGSVVLGGDTLVAILGDINLPGGVDLTIEDAFEAAGDINIGGSTLLFEGPGVFNGVGDQAADAGIGALVANSTLQKTTAGNLTLGGDTLVDLNDDVTVDIGSLLLPDGANAAGDLVASGDLTLDNAVVLDGPGEQRVDSTAAGLTVTAVNKGAGDLILGGGTSININASIDLDNGSLTIEDAFFLLGDLIASQDINLLDDGSLGNVTAQRIDAEGGTLTANGFLSNPVGGSLTLAGATAIDLNDSVGATGDLTIEDDFTAAGVVLIANGFVTFDGDGTFDGAGNQDVQSATRSVTANGKLTKTSPGDLTLRASTLVDLNDDVDVQQGGLNLPHPTQAAGDLVAQNDITLGNLVTLDGTGEQRVDSTAGTLFVNDTLTKNVGDLVLAGDTAIDINAPVDATTGSLTIEDAFFADNNLEAGQDVTLEGAGTLDGLLAQRIQADSGTLTANGALTKASGDLTLAAGTAVDLSDDVNVTANSLNVDGDFSTEGDLVAGQNVTLNGEGTFDGTGNQLVQAIAGTLTANDDLTKTTDGDLQLAAGTLVDLNGDVTVQAGGLNLPNITEAAGDLVARDDLTLSSTVTLDGTGTQRVDSTAGTLYVNNTLTKTTGDLVLAGDTAINLNAPISAQAGDLTIEDDFRTSAGLAASQNVTLEGAGTFDGVGAQLVDAQAGTLTANRDLTKTTAGTLTLDAGTQIQLGGAGAQRIDSTLGMLQVDASMTKPNGDLALGGQTGIDLNGSVDVGGGTLTIEDNVNAAGDLAAAQNVNLNAEGIFDGPGDQRVEAGAGTLAVSRNLTKTTAGDLALAAGTLIDLDGPGAQRLDSTVGTLTIDDPLTKTTAGDLNLAGASGIDVNGSVDASGGTLNVEDVYTVEGNLEAGQDINLLAGGTFDGADQRVDARGGTLTVQGAVDKSTPSNLVLAAGTLIDINAPVDLTQGGLVLEDRFQTADLLKANVDVRLEGEGTMEAPGVQTIEAETGTLQVQAMLQKAAGDLNLSGGAGIDFGASVNVPAGNLHLASANGDVGQSGGTLTSPTLSFDAGGVDLALAGNDWDTIAGMARGQVMIVDADDLEVGSANGINGIISTGGGISLTAAGGPLTIVQAVSGQDGNVCLKSTDDVLLMAHVTASEDVSIWADSDADQVGNVLQSSGTVRAEDGDLFAAGYEVTQTGDSQLVATNGTIVINASSDSVVNLGGNLTGLTGKRIVIGAGSVLVGTELAAEETAILRSWTGAIEHSPGAPQSAKVKAFSVGLLGETGIGSPGDFLRVDSDFLVTGTGSGDAYIEEVGGTAAQRGALFLTEYPSTGPDCAPDIPRPYDTLADIFTDFGELVSSEDDLFLIAGDIVGGSLIAGRNANVIVTGSVLLDEFLVPGTANVNVGGQFIVDVFDVGTLDMLEVGGNALVGTFTVAETARIDIGGNFGGDTLDVGGNTDLDVGGNMVVDDTEIGGTLTAGIGSSFLGGSLTVRGNTDLDVGGDMSADEVDIGQTLTAEIGGDLQGGALTVGGNTELDVGGGMNVDDTDIGGNLMASIGSYLGDSLAVGGNADLDVGGDVEANNVDVGGKLQSDVGGNLRIDELRAGSVDVNAGSIDMGRVDTGTAQFASRGPVRDNNSQINAGNVTLSGSTIGADGRPIVMNATRINSVSGSGDVYIRQTKSGDTPIGLLSAGGKLVVDVPNGGLSDGNGDELNIRSGGLSRFNTQYLGTSQDALEVNIGDALYLDGAGLSGDDLAMKSRIFANLLGFIEGADGRRIFYIGDVPIPGFVLLNGQILLGDQQLLAEVFRSEAFIVETPEIKSPEGVFGGPYFIHLYMQISEAWNLFLEYILYGQAQVTADPELPPEAKRTINIGGGEKPYTR